MDMKTLNKLLFGTTLATTLAFNSYSQGPKNTIVAYISVNEDKKYDFFNIDSLKPYGISFAVEKTNLLDLMMSGKPKKDNSGTQIKLYIVRKTKNETRVVPTMLEGEYDFSKDSKKEIEKQVKEFIKEEKISISDPVKYGSGEMFMEISWEEK